MSLPSEIALRQVTGHDLWDNGVGVDGIVTFTAVPRELIARTSKTTIFTRPVSVAVTAGAFTVTAGLIAWDGATTDAGQGVPPTVAWGYQVSYSWDAQHPFYITVPKGATGTIADAPLDIADCIVPQMPGGVAIMAGPPGPGNATDAQVNTFVTGPGATRTTLNATYGRKREFDPRDYGALGDTKQCSDAAITTGTAILTSATAGFTASDVGKVIGVTGAGAGPAVLASTILSRQSATQVTLAANAGTTVSAAYAWYGTDDTAAFQATLDAAGPSAGTLSPLPGSNFLISAPLVVSPAASATRHVAVPSIVASGGGGRIGDPGTVSSLEKGSVQLTAAPTFPVGQYMIDYYPAGGSTYALLGAVIQGLSLKCAGRAAGLRGLNRRRWRIQDVSIDATATPAPTNAWGGRINAAFQMSSTTGSSQGAYNTYIGCCVNGAGLDGFAVDSTQDTLLSCQALFCAGDNYSLQGIVTAIACESDAATTSNWHVWSGNTANICQVNVIGAISYFGSRGPAVQISGLGGATGRGRAHFVGCGFNGNNTGGSGTPPVVDLSGPNCNVAFTACSFDGVSNAPTYVNSRTGAAGDVRFDNCTFTGATGAATIENGTDFLTFSNCAGIATYSDTLGLATRREVAISTTTALTATAIGHQHAATVAAAYTVTLPTPVGAPGRIIGVRVTTASTNLLTLATAAGNIDGASTRIMWAGESAMLMSDGTNWVKIAGKTIPMSCDIYKAAAQSIPLGAVTTVLLDTMRRDNTGLMATIASNRITIRRPGMYTVTTRIGMDVTPSGGAARCITSAQANGTTTVMQRESNAVVSSYPIFGGSEQVTAAAADYLLLQFYQNSGSSWATLTGAGNSSEMMVTEVPGW